MAQSIPKYDASPANYRQQGRASLHLASQLSLFQLLLLRFP